jgi:hypothetical protein
MTACLWSSDASAKPCQGAVLAWTGAKFVVAGYDRGAWFVWESGRPVTVTHWTVLPEPPKEAT